MQLLSAVHVLLKIFPQVHWSYIKVIQCVTEAKGCDVQLNAGEPVIFFIVFLISCFVKIESREKSLDIFIFTQEHFMYKWMH